MKRDISIILVSILVISMICGGIAFASETSGAKYLTTIRVTNNGTALTNAIVVITDLKTSEMIESGMLDSDALEAALLTGYGGNDIAVGPAVSDSYLWCTWVSSIGANSNVNQYLYTNNATGGKIAYFPDSDGMAISDNSTIELSDNFTVEYSGWVDTDESDHVVIKPGAFEIDTGSGNITANIIKNEYTSPLDHIDPNAEWINETNAYDDNTGSFATEQAVGINSWSKEIRLYTDNFPPDESIDISTIDVYPWIDQHDANDLINLDVTAGGVLYDVYQGSYNAAAWNSYDAFYDDVTCANITFYNNDAGTRDARLYELRFTQDTENVTVSKSYASGDYVIEVSANTTHMTLTIDSTLEDTAALNGDSVPDNDNGWTVGSDSTPYLEYLDIDIDGTPTAHWAWEYAETFTDNISSIVATPTFRNASSDSDLSAVIVTQAGLVTADSPTTSSGEGWTMIGTIPEEPTGMFDEGGDSYGIGDFDFGALVTGAAETAGQDATSWHIILVFALSIAAGIVIYKLTNRYRLGQRGSLVIAVVASEVVLVFFYLMGTIPGLALIPYGLIGLLLIVWRKSAAPVD